jgi:xylose isomerase
MNIEVNTRHWPATPSSTTCRDGRDAGCCWQHRRNAGDYQNGWDTDQFPVNLMELVEAMP